MDIFILHPMLHAPPWNIDFHLPFGLEHQLLPLQSDCIQILLHVIRLLLFIYCNQYIRPHGKARATWHRLCIVVKFTMLDLLPGLQSYKMEYMYEKLAMGLILTLDQQFIVIIYHNLLWAVLHLYKCGTYITEITGVILPTYRANQVISWSLGASS